MATPDIRMGYVADVWTRQMHFKQAGDVEHGHTHDYDHLTLLAHGSLRVTVNGQSTEFNAPHMILIKAQFEHELTALQDGTVAYCIHAVRGHPELVDESMVPAGASAS